MREFFTALANKTSRAVGSHWAFIIAVLIVLIWGLTGPMFHFSDTWQLVINTGTTIITFLMVFLIQNTQNRDAKAMHLKLDELIASLKAAHNEMIDIEELSDERLEEIAEFYRKKKEEYPDDTVTAIASDVAEQAHDTAHRVAGDTAREVAHHTARGVAGDTAKPTVKDHKENKRRVIRALR